MMSRVVGEEVGHEQANMPFVAVLHGFHTEEHRRAKNRNGHQDGGKPSLFQLRGPNRPSHRQATEQQHDGVDRTERGVKKLRRQVENLGMVIPINRVGDE